MRLARFLTFDGWNTAIDGHYTLSSLSFGLPDIQEQRQTIAGMDGDLDYTDALAGRPIYKTRPLKAMLSSSFGSRAERLAVFHALVNRVHGKRCAITLPDRPGLTAYGRLTVSLKTDHIAYTEVEINGTCDPFLADGKELSETIAELSADADNLLAENNVTFLPQYSTCNSGNYSHLMRSLNVAGDVGARAVFRISVQSNSSFFAAGRVMSGRCAWFVSTDPAAKSGTVGEIATESAGFVYLIIQKSSIEACALNVVLMRSNSLTQIDTGAAACTGHFTFINNSSAEIHTILIIVNDHMDACDVSFDADVALQSGINKVAVIPFRDSPVGQMRVTFERRTL